MVINWFFSCQNKTLASNQAEFQLTTWKVFMKDSSFRLHWFSSGNSLNGCSEAEKGSLPNTQNIWLNTHCLCFEGLTIFCLNFYQTYRIATTYFWNFLSQFPHHHISRQFTIVVSCVTNTWIITIIIWTRNLIKAPYFQMFNWLGNQKSFFNIINNVVTMIVIISYVLQQFVTGSFWWVFPPNAYCEVSASTNNFSWRRVRWSDSPCPCAWFNWPWTPMLSGNGCSFLTKIMSWLWITSNQIIGLLFKLADSRLYSNNEVTFDMPCVPILKAGRQFMTYYTWETHPPTILIDWNFCLRASHLPPYLPTTPWIYFYNRPTRKFLSFSIYDCIKGVGLKCASKLAFASSTTVVINIRFDWCKAGLV